MTDMHMLKKQAKLMRYLILTSSTKAGSGHRLTIVAAGITLHEALAAAENLAGDGISVRVIDLYSFKPVDEKTLQTAARETGQILTVEGHYA